MKLLRILMSVCAVLALLTTAALAHWLPEEEMYIGGTGHGCTLAYVKGCFGEPKEKKWFNNGSLRGVRYIYGPAFSVTGRVGADDPAAEDEMTVTNVVLRGSNLSTPSGFTVGIPYATVSGQYGMGSKHEIGSQLFYEYKLEGTNRSMLFFVSNRGLITEIDYVEEF